MVTLLVTWPRCLRRGPFYLRKSSGSLAMLPRSALPLNAAPLGLKPSMSAPVLTSRIEVEHENQRKSV
jgi:hypothetical protein